MSIKLRTATLGCKVNQYETQFVREGLLGAGYELADDQEPADLCIVNTCTVTNEGDSKSRQLIRRLARDNPDSRIVVMGCYATRAPGEVAALPNVAEVVTWIVVTWRGFGLIVRPLNSVAGSRLIWTAGRSAKRPMSVWR